MSISAQTFIRQLESYMPLELAEEGDPVGLHIGTLNKPLERVMMTLDVRPAVVQEAIEKKVDLIVAKHPPIFRPIKRLTTDHFQEKMYADLLKHDIAVYAAHTNMDIITPGLNDWFCEDLGIEVFDFIKETHRFSYKKLVCFIPKEQAQGFRDILAENGIGQYNDRYDACSFSQTGIGRFRPINDADPTIGTIGTLAEVEEERIEVIFLETDKEKVLSLIKEYHPYEEPAFDIFPLEHLHQRFGIGRIGQLASSMSLTAFIAHVKTTFGLNAVTLVTDTKDKLIETVAICGGSGEKFYKDALRKGADVYITGDVYYHTGHDMIEEGLTVIDPGHYIEVRCKEKFVELFNQWKQDFNWSVDFIESTVDTNPFEII